MQEYSDSVKSFFWCDLVTHYDLTQICELKKSRYRLNVPSHQLRNFIFALHKVEFCSISDDRWVDYDHISLVH